MHYTAYMAARQPLVFVSAVADEEGQEKDYSGNHYLGLGSVSGAGKVIVCKKYWPAR